MTDPSVSGVREGERERGEGGAAEREEVEVGGAWFSLLAEEAAGERERERERERESHGRR